MKLLLNEKAFVISFDAILSLFVIFAFLLASFSLIARIEESSYSKVFLKNFSLDVLTVLDVSGKLQNAAALKDSGEIDSFLNSLPLSYCARIDIFEQGSSTALLNAAGNSCRNVPQNFFLARRFFAVENPSGAGYYTAELRAWISG